MFIREKNSSQSHNSLEAAIAALFSWLEPKSWQTAWQNKCPSWRGLGTAQPCDKRFCTAQPHSRPLSLSMGEYFQMEWF